MVIVHEKMKKMTPRQEALGRLISDIVLNSSVGAGLTARVTVESQTGKVGIRASASWNWAVTDKVSGACMLSAVVQLWMALLGSSWMKNSLETNHLVSSFAKCPFKSCSLMIPCSCWYFTLYLNAFFFSLLPASDAAGLYCGFTSGKSPRILLIAFRVLSESLTTVSTLDFSFLLSVFSGAS